MKNKILIVGAGLSGAVIARILADTDLFDILVIDKRPNIGGNLFDFKNSKGIRVHKYGPHLFHTNNVEVVNFIKKYATWIEYKHKVKAILNDGTYVTLPVNRITKEIVGEENILDTFFRPYSEKMWGMKLEDISKDIINRVPIRDDENEYYFPDDKFQLLPEKGYTNFVYNLLNHKCIKIKTSCDFQKNMENNFDHIFNSMPIDKYYDYKYGRLDYRSIKFHNIDIPSPKVLPTATVNFTNKSKYTRMTEWKHLPFHGVNDDFTSLTFEEPCSYLENSEERYYPVKDSNGDNRKLYKKYFKIKNSKTTFVGRLGLYSYLDMDQCVNIAMKTSKNFLYRKLNHD